MGRFDLLLPPSGDPPVRLRFTASRTVHNLPLSSPWTVRPATALAFLPGPCAVPRAAVAALHEEGQARIASRRAATAFSSPNPLTACALSLRRLPLNRYNTALRDKTHAYARVHTHTHTRTRTHTRTQSLKKYDKAFRDTTASDLKGAFFGSLQVINPKP